MPALQWLTTAGFLYAEIFVGFLLCLPFIRNARWRAVFNSRILGYVKSYGNFYFLAMVFIISMLFLDSVREMRKYGKVEAAHTVDLKNNPQAELKAHMKLFRAQRNFYISGFSLFMLLVLHRLITLVSRQATLEASHEAAIKQGEGATAQAKMLLDENEKLRKSKKEEKAENKEEVIEVNEDIVEKLNGMTSELSQKTAELEKAKKEVEAMKSQSEGLTKEYDRLLDEHSKLEKKLAIQDDGSKKDD